MARTGVIYCQGVGCGVNRWEITKQRHQRKVGELLLNWPNRILAEGRPEWLDANGGRWRFDQILRGIRYQGGGVSLNWLMQDSC